MCEFISGYEVTRDGKTIYLYLDDKLLAEKRTRELLEGSKGNDFLGHGAVRLVWGLKSGDGKEFEVRDFWNKKKLPLELQKKLKDFATLKQNFGKMLENYAQSDDLEYILKNAPDTKDWQGLKDFCLTPFLKDAKTETLTINVRYDLSIEELLKASKQDYVNLDITDQHFPTKKCHAVKKELVLLSFNREISAETALMFMKQLKLHPGTIKELISLSIDDPNLQRKFPIVAPGSVWQDGYRFVPYLWDYAGDRRLLLGWCESGWGGGGRFLCSREF